MVQFTKFLFLGLQVSVSLILALDRFNLLRTIQRFSSYLAGDKLRLRLWGLTLDRFTLLGTIQRFSSYLAVNKLRFRLWGLTLDRFTPLRTIQRFSSYLAGNKLRLRYKFRRLTLSKKTVAAFCENSTGHRDTLCRQHEEFYCSRGSGTYRSTGIQRLINIWRINY
jgi:hypothetical protein